MREADHQKDEFLAVLGHELRNPLAPLSTGLELLRRQDNRPELVASLHSMMSRQLSHLVRLIDDLLDLSRVTRRQLELRRAPLELSVVIEAAIDAAKYMEPNGRIRVHSAAEEAHAVVSIRDWGCGISADKLECVFDMFTQVADQRARSAAGGLGIGLALARRLIELHGGSIVATSEGLGRGSEFIIRLPLADIEESVVGLRRRRAEQQNNCEQHGSHD
jgi:signal transduction histidine kinase